MTIHKTYTCNLCSEEVTAHVDSRVKRKSFSLKFTSDGGFLQCVWHEAPVHLCIKCVVAVSKTLEKARKNGEA